MTKQKEQISDFTGNGEKKTSGITKIKSSLVPRSANEPLMATAEEIKKIKKTMQS